MKIRVIYEDNHIIVAYKPSGVLSQSDGSNKEDMLTLLKEYIKEKYNKPGNVYLGLVHRLDTNTSGVMVFARTSKAANRLCKTVASHKLNKKYYAVVSGKLKNTNNYTILTDYLDKDNDNKKAIISKNGKKAVLEYKTLETIDYKGDEFSLLDINLITGRFHQIRAQLANIGHPLYGDVKYGGKKNDHFFLGLESYSLSFDHPVKDCIVNVCFVNKEDIFSQFDSIEEKSNFNIVEKS